MGGKMIELSKEDQKALEFAKSLPLKGRKKAVMAILLPYIEELERRAIPKKAIFFLLREKFGDNILPSDYSNFLKLWKKLQSSPPPKEEKRETIKKETPQPPPIQEKKEQKEQEPSQKQPIDLDVEMDYTEEQLRLIEEFRNKYIVNYRTEDEPEFWVFTPIPEEAFNKLIKADICLSDAVGKENVMKLGLLSYPADVLYPLHKKLKKRKEKK